MATLDSLKQALRQKATAPLPSPKQSLSDAQYSDGFHLLLQGPGWTTYQDFIIPQLSQLLTPLFNSRRRISVLEIGPGPQSILGYLPGRLRQKVSRYSAFEPNSLFATKLGEWMRSGSETKPPFPSLDTPPGIIRASFGLDDNSTSNGTRDGGDKFGGDKFDVVLFFHSMYGMKPKRKFLERALEMLVTQPEGGMVVVFHRDGNLHLDGLVCHRTASFPDGVVCVADDDDTLDSFASFIAGFALQETDVGTAIQAEWRKVCRALGRRQRANPGHLLFSSPEIMMAFTKHAAMLPELTAQVPLVKGHRAVKNREACLHHPAAIVTPTEVTHVQLCVQWALKHRIGLTVVGGGHSGHCLWPNVVSVDMDAFDQVHIHTAGDDGKKACSESGPLVVAEAGCKTGDIISKALAAGLTVPLGARPSVGAGLWLQGGLGHLARLHGLACDAIVGAVVVSVDSGQVLCVGRVPSQHQPAGAVRPENEADLLWAMKGAGSNFGIVISVTFEAYAAPTYLVRNWIIPLGNRLEAQRKLGDFDALIARDLPRNCSADAYLYCDADQLRLGVTMFESFTTRPPLGTLTPIDTSMDTMLGPEHSSKVVDSVGLFDTEMYMSGMHGGHGGGKTSSFKRCLFLKNIGEAQIAHILVAAMENRPSALCYLHLLQGGGAVAATAPDAAAFGCRDWDFACVITGVWPREQDGTEVARAAVRWVYELAADLLPLSSGAYGADLGPDPRDAVLAATAFGPNRPRLARLKLGLDPRNILAYACPLPKAPMEPKLIVLVTGDSCAGKDYCAGVWVSVLTASSQRGLTARAVSISDATKREYAAATGADLNALLEDRAYKEQHRPALTAFFQDQVRERPRLPEEHFMNVVYAAADVDVLVITGMRDEAPVAAVSHLVPDSRVLEVRIEASQETQQTRRGRHMSGGSDSSKDSSNGMPDSRVLDWRPSLIFHNDVPGDEAVKRFATKSLLPFLHEHLQRLADMIRPIPDFPRPGIEFRHVLDISQQPGGLPLCTSLLQTHFAGSWTQIDAVACCEAGGFVYASALAARVNVPLVLIREAGKLPPPTVSVTKSSSHISSSTPNGSVEKRIEMDRDVLSRGASVVFVDDVFATGETLYAVLRLLGEAGISPEHVSVMAVVEFPAHRGREALRQRGFGRVNIQSLLVYGGA